VDEIVGEAFEDVGWCGGVAVGDEGLGEFGHDGRSLGVRGAALLDAEGGSGMRMEFSIRR